MLARQALATRIRVSSLWGENWFSIVCATFHSHLQWGGWEKLIECNDKFFSFLAPCTPCNHLDVSCTNVYLGVSGESRHRHIALSFSKIIQHAKLCRSTTCEIVLCTKNRFCHEKRIHFSVSGLTLRQFSSIIVAQFAPSLHSLDIVPWRNLWLLWKFSISKDLFGYMLQFLIEKFDEKYFGANANIKLNAVLAPTVLQTVVGLQLIGI